MDKKGKFLLGIYLIVGPILLLIYLNFNSKFLIPPGYDLAIDGYVVSKTLIIIFTLYLITKVGYFILKNIEKGK